MAYTTNQLLSGAYYAAGVVSRDFETLSGSQVSDGLQWVNEIISDKVVDQGLIPYETSYNFNAISGQEVYFIPDLIQISTIVFYIQNVRYALTYTPRNEYFGSPRVNNVTSLPLQWYYERVTGGGNLYLYFSPDQNYAMEIHGIFRLAPLQLGQDLTTNITTANLGVPIIYGPQVALAPAQLVVNNVDLAGDYFTLGTFTNYINSGIIPGVRVNMVVNDLVFSSITHPPVPIYIKTSGYPNGTQFIGNVAVATTADLNAGYYDGLYGVGATLTAPAAAVLTIDGYVVQLNDRVLVKDQTNADENGSYILTTLGTGSVAWVLTRSTNYDEAIDITMGSLFTVLNGSVNATHTFIQTANVGIVGLDPIVFERFTSLSFTNFSTIGAPNYKVFNSIGFDQFFTTYFRYALADRICTEYNLATPLNVVKQLMEYEEIIKKKSRLIDLRMEKVSTLQRRGFYNWAFINLGRGFTP